MSAMARGRLIRRWRRWSQLTAGLSTAARNRAMTNQPTKVLTFHSRKRAASTTTVVSRVAATVRTTCEVEALAQPTSLVGGYALGSAGANRGLIWGCFLEFPCAFSPAAFF